MPSIEADIPRLRADPQPGDGQTDDHRPGEPTACCSPSLVNVGRSGIKQLDNFQIIWRNDVLKKL